LDFGLGNEETKHFVFLILAGGIGNTLDFGLRKMNEAEFKERTKRLGLRVIDLVESLPKTKTAEVIGRQLLRSATSIGANYRAACRGKSTADVLAKLAIVEEEADETDYWLELLAESRTVDENRVAGYSKRPTKSQRW
jgi:four helix bundle protein